MATGSLPSIAIGQADDPQTSGGRAAPGAYRNQVDEKFVFDTRAWQKSIGLYLLAALGNDSVTGSGPYTHTIAQGLTVPYLSMFAKKGDGTFIAVRDSKITKLELSWADNQPLVVSVETDGTVLSFPATFTPSGADESGTLAYYTPVGGTFKYDIATRPRRRSPRWSAARSPSPRTSPRRSSRARSRPATRSRATSTSTSRWTVIPTDATLWRKILTGSVSGTSIMTTPQYGSFDVKFAKGADSLDSPPATSASWPTCRAPTPRAVRAR